jgi:multidrug efflux pump subunit AcrA (membrane-fusion protein)
MRHIAFITLAALALAACSGDKVVQEPVRPVLTQTVVPGASSTREVYSGEIRARTETDLGFRVGGKIVARTVDAGARVTRGTVLARLDPEDAQLAMQGREGAARRPAESDLALAKAENGAPRGPALQALHQPVGLRREAERVQRGQGARRSRRIRRPASAPTRRTTPRSWPMPTASWSRSRPSPARS